MSTAPSQGIEMPFKEKIYTSQFANYAHRLDGEHCAYKESVLDWENRLENEWKGLQAEKDALEASGIYSPTRLNIIESGFEGINLQRTALKSRKEELQIKIEPLLRNLVEFWPDIVQAYEWNHISHIQFSVYLRKYRGILHEGQSFGLACYNTPEVNKNSKYLIDNHRLM